MKVFISWSGSLSRGIAEVLRARIPYIINSAVPWVSSQDIYAGSRWRDQVAGELDSTRFGIVCVTRNNQHSPWINFECGALAKALGASHVAPLAIDLSPAEIVGPLSQFQGQPLTKEGLRKIFNAINAVSETALPGPIIDAQLDMWWPQIEVEATACGKDSEVDGNLTIEEPVRSDRQLLEELVDSVRALLRQGSAPPVETPVVPSRTHWPERRVVDSISTARVALVSVNEDKKEIHLRPRPGILLSEAEIATAQQLASDVGYVVNFDIPSR